MNTEDKSGPRVSIIVPVRNESEYLGSCLKSILANDYPKEDYEIFVVDGMSEDGTRGIAESLRDSHPAVSVLENPERIAPTALNRGIQKAQGEFIIRVDGHGEVTSDFIRKTVETLDKVQEAGCVGGQIVPQGKSFMSSVIALAQGSFFGGGGGSWYQCRKAGFIDTVLNPGYRRSVFDRVGLFDETLVRDQDDEFNYRLREAGYKIYFNPEIRGVYYARDSLIKLAKQYFQYGFWKVMVLKKRLRMLQVRQFVPPVFVATIFFLAAASCLFHSAKLALGSLLGIYLFFSGFVSWHIGKEKGWKTILILPLAYGAMHLGYGIGFWSGVFYFSVLSKRR